MLLVPGWGLYGHMHQNAEQVLDVLRVWCGDLKELSACSAQEGCRNAHRRLAGQVSFCRFALSAALHILCSWGPLVLQVSCYMHLCHWELFSITFVMQENLILFQPVKLLQKFLPSSSGFPFFRALDKTVSSLSLQNCTDCNELTNRISGGSCWDKQTLLNLWLIIVM